MSDRRTDYWTLYATRPAGRERIMAGVYDSREDALDTAQRLWKHGLRAAAIVGPNGEKVGIDEIERYGAGHIDSSD